MNDVARFTQQVEAAQRKLDERKAKLREVLETIISAAAELALACDRLDRAKEKAQ
jgi:multidrug resistance efflux pump